ncbi:hypothetical protein [Nonomuraea sp. NPDC049695]|uniref:aromatic-ring hydroxylase C-terminal domain-containing protein n=1 Tax=Nonomuraea sp. NPDC049695 TaxID=3154734 RepID=UPI0034339C3B
MCRSPCRSCSIDLLRARSGEGAVLIRPDGYVAWVARSGRTDLDALRAALTTWLGPGR